MNDVEQDKQAAIKIVGALRELPPKLDSYSQLDGAELVWLVDQPAVSMTWTQTTSDQGVRQFGLMVTVHELRDLVVTDDYRDWVGRLWLAIDEPHGTTAAEDVRTWFQYVP